MTQIPRISMTLQKKHTGESVAIVEGKIVAFGRDSYDAEQKAVKKGYEKNDIMTTFIMGKQYYAI